MRDENPRGSLSDGVIGQRSWDVHGMGGRSSALEGSLGDVSAFWILCDSESEMECLGRTVESFTGHRLFTWSSRLSAEAVAPAEADAHVYLRRSVKRAGLKAFPQLPFLDSSFSSYLDFGSEAQETVEPFLRRSSGYALAIGSSDAGPERWAGAAQLMEGHFSLARDFENTPELESLRRKSVALYISAAIVMGFMSIVPLNRHPVSGHVIFCPAESYDRVARALAAGEHRFSVRDAELREREIDKFFADGGDLAYL
ncbi:hypothetical protein [Streptomyces sp. BV129]|uniref:hypothetical protein n=1 Tax=Streptomyces sp. BV129 TaxID=2849671 RepID=UPI001C2EBBAD|nr:hypothetical protein [Streptomyces sp. BV129]MBV1948059.1 hypothetical protein [Streptomyces sp. BV129]